MKWSVVSFRLWNDNGWKYGYNHFCALGFNNDTACTMNFQFHLQLAIAALISGTLSQYSVSFRNDVNVNGNISSNENFPVKQKVILIKSRFQ